MTPGHSVRGPLKKELSTHGPKKSNYCLLKNSRVDLNKKKMRGAHKKPGCDFFKNGQCNMHSYLLQIDFGQHSHEYRGFNKDVDYYFL